MSPRQPFTRLFHYRFTPTWAETHGRIDAFGIEGTGSYEELDFGRHRLQLGGRVERNAYTVDPRTEGDYAENGRVEPPEVRDRDFTGMSASLGFQTDLGADAT